MLKAEKKWNLVSLSKHLLPNFQLSSNIKKTIRGIALEHTKKFCIRKFVSEDFRKSPGIFFLIFSKKITWASEISSRQGPTFIKNGRKQRSISAIKPIPYLILDIKGNKFSIFANLKGVFQLHRISGKGGAENYWNCYY